MLNFLRKLRRNNMNSKYLKYAVGEIILVVIGILIALSINNWNENRIQKIAEEKYISRLLEDARKDSVFYESRKLGMTKSIKSYETLVDFVQGHEIDTTKIEVRFLFQFFAYQSKLVQNNPNAFEQISNEIISDQLRTYFGTFEFVAIANELTIDAITSYYNPFLVKYYPKIQRNSTAKDFLDLMGNSELPGILSLVHSSTSNTLLQIDSMISVNHQLIDVLSEELKR